MLGRPREEDYKFKVSLGYTASPCFKRRMRKRRRKRRRRKGTENPKSHHVPWKASTPVSAYSHMMSPYLCLYTDSLTPN
jgi:hypothetical protein